MPFASVGTIDYMVAALRSFLTRRTSSAPSAGSELVARRGVLIGSMYAPRSTDGATRLDEGARLAAQASVRAAARRV